MMTKSIPLSQGKITLVDDEDYEYLNQWKWTYTEGYAFRMARIGSKRKHTKMHRVIMNTPGDMQTDHINGNGLDNRRANLRICTATENKRYSLRRSDNTSGHKGVTWHVGHQKWQARITVDQERIHLGYFTAIEEAVKFYKVAAEAYHGDFAPIGL